MAQDATTVDEKTLSEWLFQFLPLAHRMAEAFRFEAESAPAFHIPTRQIVPDARGPGDIDVLVTGPTSPDKAVAFEVKRVKVTAETFFTGMPGKVRELKHGVTQANLLSELGFQRTYLLIIVVTDGREHDGANFAGRGSPEEILHAIENFPGRNALRPNVGLGFVELTQPIDKDVQMAGSIGIRISEEANVVTQSDFLTKAIAARWPH